MGKKKSKDTGSSTIALNRKARHDFFIEDRLEAGLELQGWEVKSLRAGRAQISEAYVLLRNGEAFLFGAHITPLPTASTHINPDPTRTRKLLLHRSEINRLVGRGGTSRLYPGAAGAVLNAGRAKLEIGLAKGKKAYDKRAAKKEKDWEREARPDHETRLTSPPFATGSSA